MPFFFLLDIGKVNGLYIFDQNRQKKKEERKKERERDEISRSTS